MPKSAPRSEFLAIQTTWGAEEGKCVFLWGAGYKNLKKASVQNEGSVL